jgi:methylated-DNA-[protein]-cysteine S-methyltransferase
MIAYARIDSPLGELIAAATDEGLVRLAYEHGRRDELLADIDSKLGPLREEPRRLDLVRRQLDSYFRGRRRSFDLAIDWSLAPGGFMRRALEATATIPFGRVWTYRELAATAGSPRASRAAGAALGRNPVAIVIPCHRVLRSDGTIGDYGVGPEGSDWGEYLLRLEGAWPAP